MAKLIVEHSTYIRQSLDKLTYCAEIICQRSGRQNDQAIQKVSNKCLDQEVIYV